MLYRQRVHGSGERCGDSSPPPGQIAWMLPSSLSAVTGSIGRASKEAGSERLQERYLSRAHTSDGCGVISEKDLVSVNEVRERSRLLVARDAVIKAFSDLYSTHSQEFSVSAPRRITCGARPSPIPCILRCLIGSIRAGQPGSLPANARCAAADGCRHSRALGKPGRGADDSARKCSSRG